MLTLEQIKDQVAIDHYNFDSWRQLLRVDPECIINAVDYVAIIYRNQGIQQAAKLCCIHMTDGFSICSESAVLALKEEV